MDEPDGDRIRLRRRQAMKAALGGTLTAAAFTAPRVSGLSVAPDYASAASCSGGAGAPLNFNQSNCGLLGGTYCWGNTCCGAKTQTMTIDSKFQLAFTVDGTVVNNGKWSFNLNGIDPPFQSCVVQVSGTCAVGTFNGAFGPTTYTNNQTGIADNTATCGSWPSGNTITVNMTCTCA